jgi:hypothetical protein
MCLDSTNLGCRELARHLPASPCIPPRRVSPGCNRARSNRIEPRAEARLPAAVAAPSLIGASPQSLSEGTCATGCGLHGCSTGQTSTIATMSGSRSPWRKRSGRE